MPVSIEIQKILPAHRVFSFSVIPEFGRNDNGRWRSIDPRKHNVLFSPPIFESQFLLPFPSNLKLKCAVRE